MRIQFFSFSSSPLSHVFMYIVYRITVSSTYVHAGGDLVLCSTMLTSRNHNVGMYHGWGNVMTEGLHTQSGSIQSCCIHRAAAYTHKAITNAYHSQHTGLTKVLYNFKTPSRSLPLSDMSLFNLLAKRTSESVSTKIFRSIS